MNDFELTPQEKQVILDPARLKVLQDLALIDADEENTFNMLTRLASNIMGTPVSLMSMVGGDYQFFKSAHGMPKTTRSTPLSHAFCRHVVASNEPLIVNDAREHDELKTMPSIEENGFVGYLGIPLQMSNGMPLGSFCVIDHETHEWTELDVEIMRELAEVVSAEIDLRAQVHVGHITKADLGLAHQQIETFVARIDTNATKARVLEQIRTGRKKLNFAV